MKIIKKPDIPLQTCAVCECVVKIGKKDLRTKDFCPIPRNRFLCPVCKTLNILIFKRENRIQNSPTACSSVQTPPFRKPCPPPPKPKEAQTDDT